VPRGVRAAPSQAGRTTGRVAAILDVLPRIEYELSQGAVVVIEEDRYRIRNLPIDDS
jgi:hypothetical protein